MKDKEKVKNEEKRKKEEINENILIHKVGINAKKVIEILERK